MNHQNTLDPETGAIAIRRTQATTKFTKAQRDDFGRIVHVRPAAITFTAHEWGNGQCVVVRQVWYPGDHLPFTTAYTVINPRFEEPEPVQQTAPALSTNCLTWTAICSAVLFLLLYLIWRML
jgi:hypothetical protein